MLRRTVKWMEAATKPLTREAFTRLTQKSAPARESRLTVPADPRRNTWESPSVRELARVTDSRSRRAACGQVAAARVTRTTPRESEKPRFTANSNSTISRSLVRQTRLTRVRCYRPSPGYYPFICLPSLLAERPSTCLKAPQVPWYCPYWAERALRRLQTYLLFTTTSSLGLLRT